MTISSDKPAPYATVSAILDIIDRYRNRGLVKPITADVLGSAGVSDSLVPRTIQSLQTLDLIDEAGNPTETLEGLRRAKEPEFKAQLSAWIRSAYADVLSFVEPTDSETAVRDAFRTYNPVGQQARMVSLFLGLCRAAGMRPGDLAKEARPATPQRKLSNARQNPQRKPSSAVPSSSAASAVPPAIAGLLASLPAEGKGWSQEARQKFLKTFEAVLDFCYPLSTDVNDEADDINPLD